MSGNGEPGQTGQLWLQLVYNHSSRIFETSDYTDTTRHPFAQSFLNQSDLSSLGRHFADFTWEMREKPIRNVAHPGDTANIQLSKADKGVSKQAYFDKN